MSDIQFSVLNGVTKKLKDMGDGAWAEVVYAAGGGGGGGGASGDVTAAGVSGTSAQAVQGITNGVPLHVNQAGVTFVNSSGNNVNIPGLTNSSYGQLAAGASFVGTWDDVFSQPAAQILGDGDQPLRYTVEQAIDAAGADVVSTVTFTRPKSKDLCENVQLNGNYMRVTVKNIGNAPTTSFELNTTFGDLPPLPQALDNNGNLKVVANGTSNFTQKLRDAMEVWPNNRWPAYSKASGDLIQLEGNAIGASYLALSLDPLTAGTETYIESDAIFGMPIDVGVGIHLSQRTYGQEASVALVSYDDTPLTPPAEVQISSIQQATTTLTVTTAAAHNLKVGQRIGIYGVNNDSRLNYAALVVATCPTATQFTATAGPQGTIASLTVGPFSPTAAFVYARDAMSNAVNGTSMVFESATATEASFYAKSEGGDAVPLVGSANGKHSATITSTTTAYPVTATTGQYIGRPSAMQCLSLQADRVVWSDEAIDTAGQSTTRASFKQVVPSPDALYKMRIKVANRKGFTVPVGKVTSAAKTGTTTATVVCPSHGLTTGDYVVIYGNRDQTNFANLTTATVVASVVDANTFTIVWGSAVTATGYGGTVARVQGQQVLQGVTTQVAQSYSITSSIMTVVGNATWAGVSIGDLVNIHGARVDTTGVDAGIDGTYRVRDLVTTSLVLEPVGSTTIPATQSSVNIGGSIIKRTDMRISFVRLFDYERLRVEALPRPSGDSASAFPIAVQTGALSSVGTVTTCSTVTTVGSMTSGNLGIPGTIADVASAALTTTTTTSAFTPTYGCSYEVSIPVTAVSGTTPTLDVGIEESDDSGTNWFRVYDFPRITATGMYRSPKLPLVGNRVRYVQTVTGTTPSFTRAVNRQQSSDSAPFMRQLIDRTVTLTTLSSATPSINTQQCRNAQLVINLGAATTPPALQLQGSDDNGATWYAIGSPLTGVASSTVQTTVNNIQSGLLRAIVTTVGATVTAGYVLVKAF